MGSIMAGLLGHFSKESAKEGCLSSLSQNYLSKDPFLPRAA